MRKRESLLSVEKRKVFGQRLKHLRDLNKLKQEELAEKLNISRNHISNLETAAVSPSFSLFVEIKHFFNCSYDFLLGETLNIDPCKKEDATLNVFQFIRDFGEFIKFDEIEVTKEESEKIIQAIKYALSIVKLS